MFSNGLQLTKSPTVGGLTVVVVAIVVVVIGLGF